MKKLIVTADIHGSYSAWLTLTSLVKPDDRLMVAGDLFDIRYGNWADPDFAPDTIKSELNQFDTPFYYVYGNCDSNSYFPGYTSTLEITLFNQNIYLHHGHRKPDPTVSADIMIQGHTHLSMLEKINDCIYLNPGSIALPRNGLYTYATIDAEKVCLIEMKSGKPLVEIPL